MPQPRRRIREWMNRSTFSWFRTSWRCSQPHAPAELQPRKEPPPRTHWLGGWVGPLAGLDDVVKRKKILTLPWLELRPLFHLARSQSLYLLRCPGSYAGIVPQLCHGRCFFPNSFPFVSHQSSCHVFLYSTIMTHSLLFQTELRIYYNVAFANKQFVLRITQNP
jgi:hypothetical protein